MNQVIDIVVLWVDGNDPDWQKKKQKYDVLSNENELNSEARYRDWDIFNYWFRGVEKYAPWVNKIHLVTDGQIPGWINVKHPKLNIVDHADFIPEKYLPTFNARTIEVNLHRIKGLSEKFIYFNDDAFIINSVKPEDFFYKNMPVDEGIMGPVSGEKYNIVLYNVLQVIARNFDVKRNIKNRPLNWFNIKYKSRNLNNFLLLPWPDFLGFSNSHLPISYLKETFDQVWCKENAVLDKTSVSKFRNSSTLNHLVFRWWQLASNNFYPSNREEFGVSLSIKGLDMIGEIKKVIEGNKFKIVCLNDNENTDFKSCQPEVFKMLNKVLPEKSSYEV